MDKFPNIQCFHHEDKAMACYCPDCVEALCSECSYYHTLKLKHRPVPNVFIKFMPAFLLSKINRCLKHSEHSEFQTSNHGNPCCKQYENEVHGHCSKINSDGNVKNINLKGRIIFKVNAGDITGCDISETGQMVFVDNKYDCLVLHEKDGSLNRTIDLLSKPYDVAYINENKITVTQDSEILIINLETDLTERWIDLGWKCYGISYINGMLVVTLEDGKGIRILDIEGNTIRSIDNHTQGVTNAYLHGDKLYFTILPDDNKVYCSNANGYVSWTFQHQRLKGPRQIRVDKNGFLFVVYETSLTVAVISPDGKNSKVLLCEQDGLHLPKAISHFNNKLLICNSTSCTALLYDVDFMENLPRYNTTGIFLFLSVFFTIIFLVLCVMIWK